MKFPYIEELKKTMKGWETEYWSKKIESGVSMEGLYPLIQIDFQKVKEIKNIDGVKNWISQDNKITKNDSDSILDELWLETLTLSN